MRKVWSVGLAAVMLVSGTAKAQAAVDTVSRTVSVSLSATNPTTSPTFAGATLHGVIDTHALGSDVSALFFRLGTPSVTGSISGFSGTCCTALESSIWLFGATDDFVLTPGGLGNGFGNEFSAAGDGTFYRFLPSYVPGTASVPYQLLASVWLNFPGQPAGASGTGSAFVQLVGVDAVDAHGAVLQSAVFDAHGNGTFVTAPEPSTLALLAPGLLALVPVVRRRPRAKVTS